MIQEGLRSDPALNVRIPLLSDLVAAAAKAAAAARAPYSQYQVGAAVLDDRGFVTGGSNVESAAYGATICAERTAIGAAVASGAKTLSVCLTIARDADPASCCGICRQLLREFGSELLVVNASLTSDRVRWGTLVDWLPYGFSGSSLGGGNVTTD
jgi:cytidine deaminase